MDFLAICQGLGLALAAGLILGVVLPPIMPPWGVVAGAAPLGVLACAAALNGADEEIWPAIPLGVIAAGLAALVARDVASGASRRQGSSGAEGGPGRDARLQQQPAAGVAALIAVAAVAVALLSLFLPPISILFTGALAWLLLSRRRRAERKHEGLRVLR